MFYCALLLSCNLHTVNTIVIYCNLRSGLSTLELNEYCIVLYCIGNIYSKPIKTFANKH